MSLHANEGQVSIIGESAMRNSGDFSMPTFVMLPGPIELLVIAFFLIVTVLPA
jgi:hypothetical protein